MIQFAYTLAKIFEIIFMIVIGLFGVLGLYEQITGPVGLEKLLKILHIPLTYKQVFILMLVSVVIGVSVHFLRIELARKL